MTELAIILGIYVIGTFVTAAIIGWWDGDDDCALFAVWWPALLLIGLLAFVICQPLFLIARWSSRMFGR